MDLRNSAFFLLLGVCVASCAAEAGELCHEVADCQGGLICTGGGEGDSGICVDLSNTERYPGPCARDYPQNERALSGESSFSYVYEYDESGRLAYCGELWEQHWSGDSGYDKVFFEYGSDGAMDTIKSFRVGPFDSLSRIWTFSESGLRMEASGDDEEISLYETDNLQFSDLWPHRCSFGFSASGSLLEHRRLNFDGTETVVSFEYNQAPGPGRRLQTSITPDGERFEAEYVYDDAARLVRVEGASGRGYERLWDGEGRWLGDRTLDGQTIRKYFYDKAGNVRAERGGPDEPGHHAIYDYSCWK